METTILKTDLHCDSCVSKIEPVLNADTSISDYSINLDHPDRIITINSEELDVQDIISKISKVGFKADLYNENTHIHIPEMKLKDDSFWQNIRNWKRASFNTLNCLIGCSIGDFGMIIFLQAYYPETSMMWQMILATIAGLMTSIALETLILRSREKFNWPLALKTAFSMSFISMIGMELAMNTTDFLITGGKASFDTLVYWMALIPALVAGFLFPLPYNYYKLQKFGKACH